MQLIGKITGRDLANTLGEPNAGPGGYRPPGLLPIRTLERHGGGLECRSAFGFLSCPCKALVAFELVATAMHLLKVAQIRRASAATHWNDFVHFGAHWIRPCNRIIYRPIADGTGHLLREHPLSGEIAGLTVDAPWIPVAFAVRHAGWPRYLAGAVMPVSQAESSIMREAWWASRHPWV